MGICGVSLRIRPNVSANSPDMREEVCYAGAAELAVRIRSKALSPVEVMTAYLERIETLNPRLNAIVTPVDAAMERARQAESAIMRGESWGPLHGVPFTIKDCIDTVGVRGTRGSRLFGDYVASTDATVVSRLKEAGGILIGKTNMAEFALWWETDNRVFGRTENPWMQGRTPGGSSGGEGSAIAAGLSPLGVGSDLGVSIRQPAAYCGIVGLKATHGRVPLTGHWPDVLFRFMHVGPMARTVRDATLAMSIIAGPDGLDHYSMPVPVPPLQDLGAPLPRLRVGSCADGPFAPVAAEVREMVAGAAAALDQLGCEVRPVSLASWERWQPQDTSRAIYTAESDLYLEPIVAGREDELFPALRRRLDAPRPSMHEYQEASAYCEQLRREVARYFTEYDLLLCPAALVPAHPHNSIELDVDGQKIEGRNALRATIPFDLTGSPAISVPFGFSADGLPIGVQLAGRHFDEPTLLHAAAALEALHSTERRRPPV